jgi:Bacterial mobilisation protein (MobC)
MDAAKSKARSGSEKRKRQQAVRVRLDADERAKLETQAGAYELSLAGYLRHCALGDAGPRARRCVPVDRQLLARARLDLKRIGNNLNQLTHAVHLENLTSDGNGDGALHRFDRAALRSIEDMRVELVGVLAELRRAAGYDLKG